MENKIDKTEVDLLAPRYKVIADWPGREFPIGLIISNYVDDIWGDGKNYEFRESELWFKKYPHLFKRLEWWEDIKVEDMPKYMKGMFFI